MKLWRGTLVLGAMLLGSVMASGEVAARGGHGGGRSGGHAASGSHGGHFAPRFHTRVFAGAALFAPFYFYPPLSPLYVAPPMAPAPFWYFCPSLGAYYPYVADCPEGWQQVIPQPPG